MLPANLDTCVANETSIYDDENFVPECIIVVDHETEQTCLILASCLHEVKI